MSVTDGPTEWLAVARKRHRFLVYSGLGLGVLGGTLAAWIAFEWFVMNNSHEVLALVAGFTVLLGVQLLVLSTLTSLLVDLHEEDHERTSGGGP